MFENRPEGEKPPFGDDDTKHWLGKLNNVITSREYVVAVGLFAIVVALYKFGHFTDNASLYQHVFRGVGLMLVGAFCGFAWWFRYGKR